jgi:hypothetical protein
MNAFIMHALTFWLQYVYFMAMVSGGIRGDPGDPEYYGAGHGRQSAYMDMHAHIHVGAREYISNYSIDRDIYREYILKLYKLIKCRRLIMSASDRRGRQLARRRRCFSPSFFR